MTEQDVTEKAEPPQRPASRHLRLLPVEASPNSPRLSVSPLLEAWSRAVRRRRGWGPRLAP